MKKITIYTVLSLIIFCGILLISYVGGSYWIKKNGVILKPYKAMAAIDVPYYLQNDSNWGNDKIGSTEYNLSGSGCLIACLSSAVTHLNINLSPKDLNKLFSSKGVYNSNGEIIWYKINSALQSISYIYKRVFCSWNLQSDLAHKELPILKVKYHKYGVYHWVLVVGSTENDFLIVDPLEQSKTIVPLSKHGKVFAYRKIIIKIYNNLLNTD